MKENIVLPNYEHSILNTITSILKYYNVETVFTRYEFEKQLNCLKDFLKKEE